MQLITARKWTQSGIAAHPPRVLQETLLILLFSDWVRTKEQARAGQKEFVNSSG